MRQEKDLKGEFHQVSGLCSHFAKIIQITAKGIFLCVPHQFQKPENSYDSVNLGDAYLNFLSLLYLSIVENETKFKNLVWKR